eukprot:6458137-Amphidinium_carterae.2
MFADVEVNDSIVVTRLGRSWHWRDIDIICSMQELFASAECTDDENAMPLLLNTYRSFLQTSGVRKGRKGTA